MSDTKLPFRVLLSTAPRGKAQALARGLVESRLAACVNILPGAMSHYRWKGRLRRERESLLVIKTRASRIAALERWLKAHHPYDLPELLALPVAAGSVAYLGWLDQETR